jgi:hypothetical protein
VAVIMVVIVWFTLIFQNIRMGQGNGVVASFQFLLENSRSCIFLKVGAYKLGGRSLLGVVAGEFWELYLPSGWIL